VIIDTHKKDASGLELAKNCRQRTSNKISSSLQLWGLPVLSRLGEAEDSKRCAVLSKLFIFSQLLGLIRSSKEGFSN
jgi:hypothetical protein